MYIVYTEFPINMLIYQTLNIVYYVKYMICACFLFTGQGRSRGLIVIISEHKNPDEITALFLSNVGKEFDYRTVAMGTDLESVLKKSSRDGENGIFPVSLCLYADAKTSNETYAKFRYEVERLKTRQEMHVLGLVISDSNCVNSSGLGMSYFKIPENQGRLFEVIRIFMESTIKSYAPGGTIAPDDYVEQVCLLRKQNGVNATPYRGAADRHPSNNDSCLGDSLHSTNHTSPAPRFGTAEESPWLQQQQSTNSRDRLHGSRDSGCCTQDPRRTDCINTYHNPYYQHSTDVCSYPPTNYSPIGVNYDGTNQNGYFTRDLSELGQEGSIHWRSCGYHTEQPNECERERWGMNENGADISNICGDAESRDEFIAPTPSAVSLDGLDQCAYLDGENGYHSNDVESHKDIDSSMNDIMDELQNINHRSKSLKTGEVWSVFEGRA